MTFATFNKLCFILYLFATAMLLVVGCQSEKSSKGNVEKLMKELEDLTGHLNSNEIRATLEQRIKTADSLKNLNRFRFFEAKQKVYFVKALIYANEKKHNEALVVLDSLLAMGNPQETGNGVIRIYIDAIFMKGDMLEESGRYRKAFDLYYEGKRFTKYGLGPGVEGNFNHRIGMVQYKQNEFDEAYIAFNKAQKFFQNEILEFPAFCRIQEEIGNKGLCLAKLGEYDKALLTFDTASLYIRSQAHRWTNFADFLEKALAVVDGNKATILYSKGNFKAASTLLISSIETNLKPNYDRDDAIKSIIKLIDMYQVQNKFDTANNWIERLNSLGVGPASPEHYINMLPLLVVQSYNSKDYKKSADLSQLHMHLVDSFNKAAQENSSIQIQSYIDGLDKKSELNRLHETNSLQEKLIFTFMILGSFVIGFAILTLYNARILSRKNKQLNLLNNQIKYQKHELQENFEKLQLLNQERERITAIVVHDLRNPVAAIKSMSQLFYKDELSPDDLELVINIEKASTNALELMSEVMEITDAKKSKELELELSDLRKIVSKVKSEVQFLANEKDQVINLIIPNQPLHAMINQMKMSRVLENLLTNAIKFSEKGGVINLGLAKVDHKVVISVQDNGIGIPKQYHKELFTSFTAAKRKGTANEPTFGLGLSIVKEIMEAHKGKVRFESEEGAGTTFYLELELVEEQEFVQA